MIDDNIIIMMKILIPYIYILLIYNDVHDDDKLIKNWSISNENIQTEYIEYLNKLKINNI